MKTSGSTQGFTLIEALAAVVTLGLLAAAVVPLMHRLGNQTIPQRLVAQSALQLLALPDDLTAGSLLAIPGHPEWRLSIRDLAAEPEPVPPPGRPPAAGPPHRWRLVAIQNEDGSETLAETLVAVLAPGARP